MLQFKYLINNRWVLWAQIEIALFDRLFAQIMRISVGLPERVAQVEADLRVVFEDNRGYLSEAGNIDMIYNLYWFNSLIIWRTRIEMKRASLTTSKTKWSHTPLLGTSSPWDFPTNRSFPSDSELAPSCPISITKYTWSYPCVNHPTQRKQKHPKKNELPTRVSSHQTHVHPWRGNTTCRQSGDKPDLLATSGECLKIWKIKDNK